MYMTVKAKLVSFERDRGNIDKNYSKHGVTEREAEEIFLSNDSYIRPDFKHSSKEKRNIILGKTTTGIQLFVVFTMRKNAVRIISARLMHVKEVEKYEKAKENPKI